MDSLVEDVADHRPAKKSWLDWRVVDVESMLYSSHQEQENLPGVV
jgi:hypothetical protein